MPHQPSGEECLVLHLDDDEGQPCIRCRNCHEWIRPRHINDPCPKEKKTDAAPAR